MRPWLPFQMLYRPYLLIRISPRSSLMCLLQAGPLAIILPSSVAALRASAGFSPFSGLRFSVLSNFVAPDSRFSLRSP